MMPVTDLNAVKMGEEFLNLAESAETTVDVWQQNPEVIAWGIIIVIVLGIFLFLLAFLFGMLKKRPFRR